jgi:hypothetical protein
MQKAGVGYLRYVDDIRIFAASKQEVHRAVVQLEMTCRELGLIPQGEKFAIREVQSGDELLTSLPSLPMDDKTGETQLPAREAETLFRSALEGRPYQIKDKTLARYVLYRTPRSRRILDLVLRLLPRHPEHIDAFVAYLLTHGKSKRIESVVADVIRGGNPYAYVRGELWQVLAENSSDAVKRVLIPVALDELRIANGSLSLRWGVLRFLLSCERAGLRTFCKRVRDEPPLLQALLVSELPDSAYTPRGVVEDLLRSRRFEPGVVLAEQLTRRGATHRNFGLKGRELAPGVQNVFRAVGIIRRQSGSRVDQVSEVLERRYGTAAAGNWRKLLRGEYTHALQLLLQAESRYDAARGNWLQLQNSFNDTVIRQLITILNAKSLPGARRIINKKGELLELGIILETGGPFDAIHPSIATPFRDANTRRNSLPGSHPYEKKHGTRNRHLARKEQRVLHAKLAPAYAEIVALIPTL